MDEPRDLRYGSWNRRAARFLLRPLVGTYIVPNHITAWRWLTGIVACILFARGEMEWGGLLWLISTFLDRCDGEFARMTGLSSRAGYLFDLTGDILFNSIVFVALGIGLSSGASLSVIEGVAGGQWILIGCVAGGGILLAGIFAEVNEQGMQPGEKTFNGRWGFDFDDFIYLIGVIPMFGGSGILLTGALIGGPAAAIVLGWKLARKSRHQMTR
ncbi:MAG: CDP-alcohol phosphatidyltransferase family protein [Rhodospirillales bacterium]|nr:CDP-alcohol phosphatidyltransferase family protein [Rhodospirillales bacterium]